MPDPAAEWLIEDGIGEQRALLVRGDEALAAKLYWPGECFAGQVVQGQLVAKASGANRGTMVLADGQRVLVDRLPRAITEGESVTARVWRAAIWETGRYKQPHVRALREDEVEKARGKSTALPAGRTVRRFPAGLWEDVWTMASAGAVPFPGGELILSATPAMTLIDIDCIDSRAANLDAIPAIARTLRLLDIGGNIGIDFPTVVDKRDRKAIDDRLSEYLADWPHERTAMNGFGFVQIVARLQGPSLLHRFAASRTGMAARMALRRAEMVEGAGITLLSVHPTVKARFAPEWIAQIERRTGRPLRLETDPGLAIEAASAQIVPHE